MNTRAGTPCHKCDTVFASSHAARRLNSPAGMLHLTESLVLTTSAAIAGVSFLLLVYAWRGRLTDDQPLCRKCGFDLFGLPETSRCCPECGAELSRKRATRVGHRRKRGPLLVLGTLLLLLGATPPVGVQVARARGVD